MRTRASNALRKGSDAPPHPRCWLLCLFMIFLLFRKEIVCSKHSRNLSSGRCSRSMWTKSVTRRTVRFVALWRVCCAAQRSAGILLGWDQSWWCSHRSTKRI